MIASELIASRSRGCRPRGGWPSARSGPASGASSPRARRRFARRSRDARRRAGAVRDPRRRGPARRPGDRRRVGRASRSSASAATSWQRCCPDGHAARRRRRLRLPSTSPLDEVLAARPRLVAVLAHVRDPATPAPSYARPTRPAPTPSCFADASVDPYNGKCVRASAGSLFHLPLAVDGDRGGDVAGAACDRAARAGSRRQRRGRPRPGQRRRSLDGPTAWVFGNEAWGLPADTRRARRRRPAGADPRPGREPQPRDRGRGLPLRVGPGPAPSLILPGHPAPWVGSPAWQGGFRARSPQTICPTGSSWPTATGGVVVFNRAAARLTGRRPGRRTGQGPRGRAAARGSRRPGLVAARRPLRRAADHDRPPRAQPAAHRRDQRSS